ncbi:MAG: polyprenyl synthetase family protein, partial [Chloroflexi bacterium]|nr:polyprenyl synthetase family protein [Chloroflexota bacterium]
EAISGRYDQAGVAAAAVELLWVSADTFDEIEDDDTDVWWRKWGSPVAVNLAAGLMVLSQQAALRLEQSLGRHVARSALQAINHFMLRSLAGQHKDLTFERQDRVSQQRYLAMVREKSASVIECCCYLGALAAAASKKFVARYSAFGRNLGVAAQIKNDAMAFQSPAEAARDIARKKKTLPIIFAFAQARGADRRFLKEAYSGPGTLSTDTIEGIRQTVLRLGGVHYSLAVSELYRKKALDALTHPSLAGHNKENLIALADLP